MTETCKKNQNDAILFLVSIFQVLCACALGFHSLRQPTKADGVSDQQTAYIMNGNIVRNT